MFQHVDAYAGDPILSLMEGFMRDSRSHKVNLSIGLYYDAAGHVPLLPSVQKAESFYVAKHEPRIYLPIEGLSEYRTAVQHLVFGSKHTAVTDGRIATIQTIGGSGALKVAADFLKRYFPQSGLWVSDPTWDNHRAIFEKAGIKVDTYPYYDSATNGIHFAEMLETLAGLPEYSLVLLHPCCHNPTGVDLDRKQWQHVIKLVARNKLIPIMDMAYQGFGDGIDDDAWAVRAMVDAGVCIFVCSSFSKNMSLYGERCGSLSVVCPDSTQMAHVLGQLKYAVRCIYSSPPVHGAKIVTTLLSDHELGAMWRQEVAAMRDRIQSMRQRLHEVLSAKIKGQNFNYLRTQKGMFSYTGLSPQQVDRLREEYAVYLVRSGRMCVAGLNDSNINYVAESFAAVLE